MAARAELGVKESRMLQRACGKEFGFLKERYQLALGRMLIQGKLDK
jgi:hypothetical protein